MIKSSLGAAGMTECLINCKYVVFAQPNQMDGKYCLSWQVGPSINIMLLVLVVASSGRLSPIITFTLLSNLTTSAEDCWQRLPLRLSTGGKVKDKSFLLGWSLCFYLRIPAHVPFLEPQSIFPSHPFFLHTPPPPAPPVNLLTSV